MAKAHPSPFIVSALGWTAAVAALTFVALLVAIGVTSLVDLPAATFAIGSAMIVTVIVSAVTWMLWGIIDANLVTDGRWDLGSGPTRIVKIVATVCVGLIAVAIIPIGLIIVAGSGMIDGDALGPVAGGAVIALIGVGILGAAIAGGVALGGPAAAWIGVIFTIGLVGVAIGIVSGEFWAVLAGSAALGLSLVGYYVVGADAGRLPASIVSQYGDAGSGVAGVILAIVGLVTREPFAILGGTLIAAAFVGVVIARRRRAAQPVASSHGAHRDSGVD